MATESQKYDKRTKEMWQHEKSFAKHINNVDVLKNEG